MIPSRLQLRIDLSRDHISSIECLPRPRLGVLHVPLVINGLINTRDLIEINLKKIIAFINCTPNLSLGLDFKIYFGNHLHNFAE